MYRKYQFIRDFFKIFSKKIKCSKGYGEKYKKTTPLMESCIFSRLQHGQKDSVDSQYVRRVYRYIPSQE